MPETVEWEGLVMEAERRFIARYGDHPEILLIGSSCRFDNRNPVAILVRTRLSAGQYLRELPCEFLSFNVKQEPVGDEVAAFKSTWTAVLSRLFGWPDDTIRDWLDNQERVYQSAFFLHDAPCYYLRRSDLARSVVGPREESELRMIGEELVRAIGGKFYVDQETDFDWDKARERIAGVIKHYPSR